MCCYITVSHTLRDVGRGGSGNLREPPFQINDIHESILQKLIIAQLYVHIFSSNLTTKLAWSTKMIIARCSQSGDLRSYFKKRAIQEEGKSIYNG